MEIEANKIYHCDNIDLMRQLANESINVILTDPPYLYLKNQKLERKFDEQRFFSECKRILKKDGFIVLFGRGTSFYRWNTILNDIGFKFKEEVIWDKKNISSPMLPINRVHETISIHTKTNGTINTSRVPYLEMNHKKFDTIHSDLQRFLTTTKNKKHFEKISKYLENIENIENTENAENISSYRTDFHGMIRGGKFDATVKSHTYKKSDSAISALQTILFGAKEKSIISVQREQYMTIHPTQKAIRLLERILLLTSKEGNLVFDPFSGSGSTAEACIKQNRKYICCEIDKEYYDASVNRINCTPKNLFAF